MTALHDPLAGLTPTQRKEAQAHRQRLMRLRSNTRERQPIEALREIALESDPEIEAKVEPVLTVEDWVQRQKELHAPLEFKPLWFSIEDDLNPEPARPCILDIQIETAKYFGVGRSDLLSSRRTANVVRPRQVAMYLAKTLTLRSLPEIGRRFGGRDHTTVLHAVRKMHRLAATDPDVARAVGEITTKLGGENDTNFALDRSPSGAHQGTMDLHQDDRERNRG